MNLYILRHGIAVERGTPGYASDAARPLTPKGKRKLRQIAQALKEMDLSFDLILSSPYVRARQSAEIVAQALGCRRRLELSDVLEPSAEFGECIAKLASVNPSPGERTIEDVLLVGHEPYLSLLVSLLISGRTDARVVLKKGGLCKLSAESLKPGRCAELEWLLTPKQLQRLA